MAFPNREQRKAMMTPEVVKRGDYSRGKNNAMAIAERQGFDGAYRWIKERQADHSRKPLSDAYVRGFMEQLAQEA